MNFLENYPPTAPTPTPLETVKATVENLPATGTELDLLPLLILTVVALGVGVYLRLTPIKAKN
jgi:hypothetical protein